MQRRKGKADTEEFQGGYRLLGAKYLKWTEWTEVDVVDQVERFSSREDPPGSWLLFLNSLYSFCFFLHRRCASRNPFDVLAEFGVFAFEEIG